MAAAMASPTFTNAALRDAPTRVVLSLPEDVVNELGSYIEFRDGWDKGCAPAPTTTAIGSAAKILTNWFACRLSAGEGNSYELAPSLDGGVNLIFDRTDRWVSLFCRNNGTLEIERSDSEEFAVSTTGVSRCAIDQIRWVLGK